MLQILAELVACNSYINCSCTTVTRYICYKNMNSILHHIHEYFMLVIMFFTSESVVHKTTTCASCTQTRLGITINQRSKLRQQKLKIHRGLGSLQRWKHSCSNRKSTLPLCCSLWNITISQTPQFLWSCDWIQKLLKSNRLMKVNLLVGFVIKKLFSIGPNPSA